jgi:hypothetical protein
MLWLRPSRVLGLFFGAQLSLLMLLAWWQGFGTQWLILKHSAPQLSNSFWWMLAVLEAVLGWYVTSYMEWRKKLKYELWLARKQFMLWLRPSRVLGLFFAVQLSLLLALVWWQKTTAQPHHFLGYSWAHLTLPNWVVLAGVEAAVWGWVVTSYMTLRNSIKQHTINTLLQSRISATYMEHANCINKEFFPPTTLTYDQVPLEYFFDEKNFPTIKSVAYLLNYFEFLSAAIRHGDLDEKMLRSTLGGILGRFYERMMLFIKHQRGEEEGKKVANPRQLEHFTWLYKRWKLMKAEEDELASWNLSSSEKQNILSQDNEAAARQVSTSKDSVASE